MSRFDSRAKRKGKVRKPPIRAPRYVVPALLNQFLAQVERGERCKECGRIHRGGCTT